MAKKRDVKAVKGTGKVEESPGKTRVELRFDSDVYDRIKGLADQAEVSVNQLMHGLARWAAEKLWVGEPVKNDQGHVSHNGSQKGCLWAGETAIRSSYSAEEKRRILQDYEDDPQLAHHVIEEGHVEDMHKGKVFVRLDFTERRVVRED